MRIEERVASVLRNLSYFNLSFPSPHMRAVEALLEEFSHYLGILESEHRSHDQAVQIAYDLLLVYTSRIEQVLGKRDWTVNTMLQLLDQCIAHPDMRAAIRQDHPIRRGLVLHKHLSWSELIALAKDGYARMKSMFRTQITLSFGRKLKLTLGNIFAGPKNMMILSKIHPYLTQLNLPFGPLKNEYHGFINQLLSDVISHPKMNNHIALLSLRDNYAAEPSIVFDFQEAMRLLIYLSDNRMLTVMGDSPDSLDVKAVRSKIILMRQLRVMLFSGSPSRVQSALHGRALLKKTFKAIFSPMQALRPVYTWGSALDEAFNDLLDEMKSFSRDMLQGVTQTPQTPPTPPRVISWNIIRFWRGAGHAFYSTISMISGMITAVMPKINSLMQRFMPENKISSLIADCTPHIYSIIEHSVTLGRTLEQQGLYDDVTQGLIAPLRRNLLNIDVKALQHGIAIYKHKFEPMLATILEQNDNPAIVWGRLPLEEKNELILNAAALIHHLRQCFFSLMPLMDPRTLGTIHAALGTCQDACVDFDSIIGQITVLQILLKKDGEALIAQAIELLNQSGDSVSAGSATNTALKQSLGIMVGGTLGIVAEKTVDTMNIFHLDLSFNPTQAGVHHMPAAWRDKHLKIILKEELIQVLALMKQFNALNLGSQYDTTAMYTPNNATKQEKAQTSGIS